MKATAPTFDGTQPCTTVDPETFFPEAPERPKKDNPNYATALESYKKKLVKYKVKMATAKNLCNSCIFVEPCLDYALKSDVVGIWGATDERERNSIRRQRKLPTPESMSIMTASWATPVKKKRGTP